MVDDKLELLLASATGPYSPQPDQTGPVNAYCVTAIAFTPKHSENGDSMATTTPTGNIQNSDMRAGLHTTNRAPTYAMKTPMLRTPQQQQETKSIQPVERVSTT